MCSPVVETIMSVRRFSIVITCYNQERFIRAALDSALSQCEPTQEVIVVNDGSRDGSKEALEAFGDSIVLINFSANRGASEARNYGASLASGEYVVFLDGDECLDALGLKCLRTPYRLAES